MIQPAQQQFHTDQAPSDLAGMLAPVHVDEFLRTMYGQHFQHIPGERGKFAALLPWDALNDILEQHRLEPPRLRLTREGQPVPAERYVSWTPNRRRNGQPVPRLHASALTRELREGATLVLDAVDELHRPVRRLAESLERMFHVRVQVNAYAGWRTSHGFDVHWDDHDVFVLQIAGRKQWKIYGMTRAWPLARDIEPAVDPPSEVLWEGLLQTGDVLYIPRGWWHVATPLDEPTLHLTVGVNNLTGVDLLTWFVDRLRAEDDVRRDLPLFGGAPAEQACADRLRNAILTHWRPEIVSEFLADNAAKGRARPGFALPWTATPDVLPEGRWRVRWSSARVPVLSSDNGNGEVSVLALGRRWKFAPEATPLLERLTSGDECSLSDLKRVAAGSLSPDVIRTFVKELVADGLLVVC